MSKIKFEDGSIVNFDGIPTQQDVEEVANKLGIKRQEQTQQPQEQSSIFAGDVKLKGETAPLSVLQQQPTQRKGFRENRYELVTRGIKTREQAERDFFNTGSG